MVEACAVSQDQTKNTMDLVPGLLTAEAKSWYGIQPNTLAVHAMGGTRKMLATTSNPKAIEGHRPSLVIRNETQNWVANNNGLEMAKVINGNISKTTKARQARILDICNAYVDGLGSHAQSMREGWEGTQGDNPDQEFFGLLYDSLEAPPEAPLTPEEAPDVIRAVRGDSTWLDIERIVQDIMDPTNPPSESRRKWYNQVQSEEDAWVTATEWDRCKDNSLLLDQGDEIAIFFDGGKSDDATAAVACRITDGAVFTVGMWQRPPRCAPAPGLRPAPKLTTLSAGGSMNTTSWRSGATPPTRGMMKRWSCSGMELLTAGTVTTVASYAYGPGRAATDTPPCGTCQTLSTRKILWRPSGAPRLKLLTRSYCMTAR